MLRGTGRDQYHAIKRPGMVHYNTTRGSWQTLAKNLGVGKQVTKAKAPKRPGKGENSEEIKPETPEEQVTATMVDFLKSAAAARTARLSVSGLTYTSELQKTLLSHAELMEATYSSIKTAMAKKPDEKTCKQYKKKLVAQMDHCKNLQVFMFQTMIPQTT